MSEKRTEVRTFRIDYICDCGEGEMLSTGFAHLTSPPQKVHKCNKCGATKTFNVDYPRMVTEDKEEEK